MSQPTIVADRILDALHCAPGCTLDVLVLSLSELTWNQVFLEVDRLSRTGQVWMTRMDDGTYKLRLTDKDKRRHGLLTGRIVVKIPHGNRSDQTVPQATSD